MTKHLLPLLWLCFSFQTQAAQSQIERAPLQMGVIADGSCSSDDTLTKEAGALAVLAAQVAAKTVVSVIKGVLDEAGKDKTVLRIATGAGVLYRQGTDGKLDPASSRCITFWYGRRGSNAELAVDEDDALANLSKSSGLDWSAKEKPLLRTWAQMKFTEVPYLFGQVVASTTPDGKLLLLQQRSYFVRPAPDLESGWRAAPSYATVVELSAPGQDKPFATIGVGLQSPVDKAVLMTSEDLSGRASGWFTGPEIDAPKSKVSSTGRFSIKVLLTATQPGSALAKALGGALDQSTTDAFIKAATPQLSSEKDAEKAAEDTKKQTALADVFDADVAVASAQKELDAAVPADKPSLEIKLRKAKFLADAKRSAAGLAQQYNIKP